MSVTAPKGFRAAGVAAGIKGSGALDLALVVNDGPQYAAAGAFTSNKVKAAPVLWSEQVLTGGTLRAVVLRWPDEAVCWPGHGPSFRLGDRRAAIEAFVARDHGDFYGDATWTP